MISPSNEQPETTAAMRLLMALAIAAGVAVRALALQGELWLDESWSVLLVQEAGSPLGLVTEVRHDNNHILNSLWLWLMGPAAAPELQRLPSLIFAVASLALVAWIAGLARLGWAGALWLLLCAVSYPSIVVGTEARGYSIAMAASLAAFGLALRLGGEGATRRTALSMALVGTVGAFSHAVFILAFIPIAGWLLLGQARGRRGWMQPLVWGAIIVPSAAIAGLWIIFYRGITVGGGPQAPFGQVILSALSLGFGGEELAATDPEGAAISAGIALLVAAIAAVEALLWLRRDRRQAALVVAIIVSPFVAVTALRPDFILARYFIVSGLFLYLLVALWLVRLARQGVVGALVAAALIGGVSVGNVRHCAELLTFQRSHFEAAVLAIAAQDGGGTAEIRVGGGHRNRNEIRLAHMRLRGLLDSRVVFVDEGGGVEPPAFFLEESIERSNEPPPASREAFGATYALKDYYPAPYMSGASLSVYELKLKP